MIYTIEDKNKLPNIRELVSFIKRKSEELPIRHLLPIEQRISDDSCFIVTRTGSGRTTFKPNITNKGCLFTGISEYNDTVTSEAFKGGPPNFLLDNIRREEFELVMESYPLYQLLKEGIEIPNYRKLVIENPYGLAMSYGFPTQLQPLTSCLDIAAYWAVSEDDGNGGRKLVDTAAKQSGMLYMFYLPVQMGMISGLSCIGKQAFVRPGLQKMFALHLPQGTNFNAHPLVRGFEFRHDTDADSYFFNKFQGEHSLYPDNDLLARKVKAIKETNQISNAAFERNLQNNSSDDKSTNIAKLDNAGIEIKGEQSDYLFTDDELNDYYAHSHGVWTKFCEDIVFNEPKGEELRQRLLAVPEQPAYKRYFEKEVAI